MGKLIIEARVNEYMMRDAGNPHVPYLPEEIVADALACRKAGASIVHFHARKPDGSPDHDVTTYARTVSAIRRSSDILVHPTLGDVTLDADPEKRLAHIIEMAKDPATGPHLAPADMGSLNLDIYNPQARRFETQERVYRNSTGTLAYFCEHMKRAGVKPYLTCWNVGFTRCAAAFIDLGIVEEPAFMSFILTDNSFLGGHPGTLQGLRAHTDFLPENRRVVWSVIDYGGNLLRLASAIIAAGGNISIGIGDYHYPELGQPTNAELVERVVAIARDVGREVATPDEAKAMLGIR
jgi:3-keto-5-aminohexanoate cleavage enzyme